MASAPSLPDWSLVGAMAGSIMPVFLNDDNVKAKSKALPNSVLDRDDDARSDTYGGPSLVATASSSDQPVPPNTYQSHRFQTAPGGPSQSHDQTQDEALVEWYFRKMALDDRFSTSVWEACNPLTTLTANSFDRTTGRTWTQLNYCNIWCLCYDFFHCLLAMPCLCINQCVKGRQNRAAIETLKVLAHVHQVDKIKALQSLQYRTCCFCCCEECGGKSTGGCKCGNQPQPVVECTTWVLSNTATATYVHEAVEGPFQDTYDEFLASMHCNTQEAPVVAESVRRVAKQMMVDNRVLCGAEFKRAVLAEGIGVIQSPELSRVSSSSIDSSSSSAHSSAALLSVDPWASSRSVSVG